MVQLCGVYVAPEGITEMFRETEQAGPKRTTSFAELGESGVASDKNERQRKALLESKRDGDDYGILILKCARRERMEEGRRGLAEAGHCYTVKIQKASAATRVLRQQYPQCHTVTHHHHPLLGVLEGLPPCDAQSMAILQFGV